MSGMITFDFSNSLLQPTLLHSLISQSRLTLCLCHDFISNTICSADSYTFRILSEQAL